MAVNLLAPAPTPFAHLLTQAFWNEHFPELSTSETVKKIITKPAHFNKEELADLRARVLHEGYIHTHDDDLAALTEKLGTCVKRLVAMKLSPVFIWLFDETWEAFARLDAVIHSVLDGDYMLLPDFWAWHVDPAKGEGGWRPHRDKGAMSLDAKGNPVSFSVWLPLSEATTLNGCMYVLPIDRDPIYRTEKEHEWNGVIDLTDIRALPAKPGDILGWNQALLHWGAKTSPYAPAPRMSLSIEFQRRDMEPFNQPQIAPLTYPDFSIRTKLVAKQMLQFVHMYKLSPDMRAWAEKAVQA